MVYSLLLPPLGVWVNVGYSNYRFCVGYLICVVVLGVLSSLTIILLRTRDQIVQVLIYVQALVFDLAQLTCQKRSDCRNAILGSSAILLGTSYKNCGSSFAVGRHLCTYPTLNEA